MKEDHQLFPDLASRIRAEDLTNFSLIENSGNSLAQIVNPSAQITISEQLQISLNLRDPNLLLMQNFISEQECSELINFAESKLENLPKNILEIDIPSKKGGNSLLSRIEQRLALLTQTSIAQLEEIHFVQLKPLPNLDKSTNFQQLDIIKEDLFSVNPPIEKGGNRIATVIIYLNSPYDGGNTLFPKLNLSIAPKIGYACYFNYLHQSKQFDLRLKYQLLAPKGDSNNENANQWLAITRLRQAAILS